MILFFLSIFSEHHTLGIVCSDFSLSLFTLFGIEENVTDFLNLTDIFLHCCSIFQSEAYSDGVGHEEDQIRRLLAFQDHEPDDPGNDGEPEGTLHSSPPHLRQISSHDCCEGQT